MARRARNAIGSIQTANIVCCRFIFVSYDFPFEIQNYSIVSCVLQKQLEKEKRKKKKK